MIVPARTQNEKMALIGYLASKIGVTPERMVGAVPFEVVAVTRQEKPRGAVLYLNKRSHTIEMSWAGEPGWLSQDDIRTIWAYPFEQLGCLTVTGTIHVKNAKSRALAERMGCQFVGIIPHAFGENEDGALYCMRRDACPWLDANKTTVLNGEMHVG